MNEQIISDAVLVGVAKKGSDGGECERSLDELARLLDTAGGRTFAKMIQSKENEDPRTCIGSGKLEELKNLCSDNDIHLVVFDTELSPSQIRNIEDALDVVDVIDRSMLILDIFALHATTAEGKLQVELAQLRYTAPRLIGKGKQLSRQEGRIGTRGPGESKLETDRRHLAARAAALEAALHEMERTRSTMRAARERSGLKKVAIVGYTNAGKSTLLNRLTDAGVLAENKLFATLDPTTRRLELPGGTEVLLSDTVGFIAKLPHHLVEAFRATLEEFEYADLLVHVIDSADPEREDHIAVVNRLIAELAKPGTPVLECYNKCDLVPDDEIPRGSDKVAISAANGYGLDALKGAIETQLGRGKHHVKLLLPYQQGSMVAALHDTAQVLSSEYADNGIQIDAVLDETLFGKLRQYVIEEV